MLRLREASMLTRDLYYARMYILQSESPVIRWLSRIPGFCIALGCSLLASVFSYITAAAVLVGTWTVLAVIAALEEYRLHKYEYSLGESNDSSV